jgi:tRNA A37 threonylcarbamoyladenosine synthetase subunit TsaC/SUA5/YrdC
MRQTVSACKKISSLKKRSDNKSFILLAPSISFALEFSAELEVSQIEFLESVWPGHVTVIMTSK